MYSFLKQIKNNNVLEFPQKVECVDIELLLVDNRGNYRF